MPVRISALSRALQSPGRLLAMMLVVVFAVEVAVMLLLPHIVPRSIDETGAALLDAMLLTLVCAPVLWWVVVGPLRRIAIQEQARSETIVANAGEGILTLSPGGQITSANRSAGLLFQQTVESLVGQEIRQVLPDLALDRLATQQGVRGEGVRRDGSRFPVQVSLTRLPQESGSAFIAILHDLTEAERNEREKVLAARQTEALRAQQMATLAQLATGVAHEIRNPLTSIKMLIQVNRTKFAENGLPTEDLELVEQEIRRMERSVNSLLEYGRPEPGEFRSFDLRETIVKTERLLEGRSSAAQVTIEKNLPDAPLLVVGDPNQLQQLLLNLSLNACDAMETGGVLRFEMTAQGDSVLVAVSDTGSGIQADILDQLFLPFQTTKKNGVGLGLGICRRIAETHRGRLEGRNQPAGGALFELTLPLSPAAGKDA
ncbi:two-component system sensor histidine kinase NtrB [Lignipirellula cremea]|uniref:histidine kinase n=1 Tax=Lignipirellula cremea TaxID=2528010 RepID=A0A518DX53_9BACT|nr:ATP-binding protein [Lignipirellula cremea]QDU96394.1 Sensor protein ZraS [Lignipirellula cremea]